MIWGLVLPWAVQFAVAQGQEPVCDGESVPDLKPAKKERAHPVRWDFEALEGRFNMLRMAIRDDKVTLVCQAKAEGIVKASDFRFSVFDEAKNRLAARRTVRLLKWDTPLEEPGARAGAIKVKAGEEFGVALDGVLEVEEGRYVVVGSDENPREPGPPPEAPTGFERPELILDGSEYGKLYPAFADIDGDGKIDMLVGNWLGRSLVFRNKGTNARPEYSKPQWLDETVPSAKIRDVQG
jgi:hypothetical protein